MRNIYIHLKALKALLILLQNFLIVNALQQSCSIQKLAHKDDPKNQEFIAKITKFNPSPIIIPLNKKEEKEEILFNSSTLVEKRNIHLELQGGSKIITFTENKRKSCSMGLMVTKNGSDFIATAGHCAEEVPSPRLFYLESIDHINREIGPMVEFSLSRNNLDMESSEYLNYYIVDSSPIKSNGIHVCKSGQKTGITCGKVVSTYTLSTFDSGDRIVGAFSAYLINDSGDSGGSMYRYNGGENSLLFVDAVGIFLGGGEERESIAIEEPIRKIFKL
ncbi:21635_t:CDS:2, partial [Gigaspora rosea]